MEQTRRYVAYLDEAVSRAPTPREMDELTKIRREMFRRKG